LNYKKTFINRPIEVLPKSLLNWLRFYWKKLYLWVQLKLNIFWRDITSTKL